MHEYCVELVASLPPQLNARVDALRLCDRLHANKLAVCLGAGSRYDKHYDNMGGADLRKLTVLLYLQRSWSPALGGEFRMYTREACAIADEPAADEPSYVDIAPLGGRLLAFWADEMVHAVNPSEAPGGEDEHRWALTCWLQATEPEQIRFDAASELRHFSSAVRE